jgi:hypothetical protein
MELDVRYDISKDQHVMKGRLTDAMVDELDDEILDTVAVDADFDVDVAAAATQVAGHGMNKCGKTTKWKRVLCCC